MTARKLAGRYEMLGELGRGGMAAVYRAHDHVLGRDVALKILRFGDVPDHLRERFEREARLVAQLDHPGIVPVYDFHRDDHSMFYVMPIVDGTNLGAALDHGPLTIDMVLLLGERIADALSYGHSRGVIHRDVKPENVMVSSRNDGEPVVKLTDYGIAIGHNQQRITVAGGIIGTPAYLSPEQIMAGPIDSRADIYMLGTLLYESLTGRPPFELSTLDDIVHILHDTPERPSNHREEVPPELDELIMHCLQKQPSARPQRADEVARRLGLIERKQTRIKLPSRPPPTQSSTSIMNTEMVSTGETEDDALGEQLLVSGDYLAAREAFMNARAKRLQLGKAGIDTECEHQLRLANLAHKIGQYNEAANHCRDGLQLMGDSRHLLGARLAAAGGLACSSSGEFAKAANWIELALEHLSGVDEADGERAFVEAMVRRTQGNILVGRGSPVGAIDAYARSLELVDPETDRWEHSIALFNVGEACTLAGRYPEAMDYLSRAFHAKSAIGDRWGLSYVYAMRARICLDQKDLPKAMAAARDGMRLSRTIGDPKLCAMHGTLLARIHTRMGRLEIGGAVLDQAAADAASCRALPEIIDGELCRTELMLKLGNIDAACKSATAALELAQSIDAITLAEQALLLLGRAEAARNRDEAARTLFAKAAKLAERTGHPHRIAEVVEALRGL